MVENKQTYATSYRSHALKGTPIIPGDKSISQRSLILGLLSTGKTCIKHILDSEDVQHTLSATVKLGAEVVQQKNGDYIVQGRGVGLLKKPQEPLYLGNSGTGVRLIKGVVASHPFDTILTGDASLSKRPMNRVTQPLSLMGAEFCSVNNDKEQSSYLPLKVIGARRPIPIEYQLNVPSAQVKSALILAALNTPGTSEIIEPLATRDHTERMLKSFQVNIQEEFTAKGAKRIRIKGHQELQPCTIVVPADPSSAAFFIGAALIVPESDILLENILMNPTRIGFLKALRKMGGNITISNRRTQAGEEIADINVTYSRLKGIHLNADIAPSMIDEYPILAVVSAFAQGESYFEGLGELRVKESDRLSAIVEGLKKCGVECHTQDDNLRIMGTDGNVKGMMGQEKIVTQLDHRIAMSFLIMGLATHKPVSIDDHTVMRSSFPNFMKEIVKLGGHIESA